MKYLIDRNMRDCETYGHFAFIVRTKSDIPVGEVDRI